MILEAGTLAPEFTLTNQDGQSVCLSDHLGKNIIVYFYPAASTQGCTIQACDFRDNINSLKSTGYTVLGISPDKQNKLKKFQEKQDLNFDLLSDEDSEVQKAYGRLRREANAWQGIHGHDSLNFCGGPVRQN
jgi:peroxiredoxin Q/BCP